MNNPRPKRETMTIEEATYDKIKDKVVAISDSRVRQRCGIAIKGGASWSQA